MKRASLPGVAGLLVLMALAAQAHDGPHAGDADEKTTAFVVVEKNRPQRLPDGQLFVPKAVQRSLQLRTAVAAETAAPEQLELLGEVLSDPESRGSLKAPQAGRLDTAEAWPLPGQRVVKGQVLAWLLPVMVQAEDARRRSELALLEQKLEVAKVNSRRLSVQAAATGGIASVNNIYYEQAELERAALEHQLALARRSLAGRVALRAPFDGVVYAAPVRSDEVVTPGQALFEITDPQRLRIAATTFDPLLATRVRAAQVAKAQDTTSLQLRGVESLTGQAGWRLLFEVLDTGKATSGAVAWLPGQLLSLRLEAAATGGRGDVANACVPQISGAASLWVHAAAERFELRSAATCAQALATLKAGERRVVEGAALLAQY